MFNRLIKRIKNTVKALKYPSADAVPQNVHKSDTTASNALCQLSKMNDKIKMAAIASVWIAHENGQCQ